ncbi:receptor-like kinase TMK4 [Dendrobium catenatum]|uniref:Putative receptor protein kinase TMK1 n=1 Tax=Dendrobium catenatum TaxID=906689 RepID=A0A2I0WM71_9ASPA|nr:receptor-like kinase TMK4 [Dendrobium catenatum]PKU76746.1 putative receptor protein kinase TMK1 [Dendrobium catenatum]
MMRKKGGSFTSLYLFVVALLLAGACVPSSAAGGENDAAVIEDLVKGLKNAPVDWKAGSDPCSPKWSGVSCSGGRITGINLRGRGIAGTLPASISSLSGLQSLFLSGNQLSGPLPSLGGLAALEVISLDSNLFSSVPSDFFSGLSSLQKLSINDNPLSPWQLPDSLADCPLTSVSASNASVFGPLPDFFDRLSSLQFLRLSYNNLSGPLPASLSRSQIRNFILNNQQGPQLSGRIDVIGKMSQLSLLWLQSNAFSGPIPDLSNLTSLQSFNLRDNALTGVVPSSLTAAASLLNVSLSNNNLQGPMPKFGPTVSADIEKGNNFCLPEAAPCDSKVMKLLAVAAGFGYPALLASSWTGNDPCGGGSRWFGVICDQQGNIMTLNFANQHLEGFIAPEIANISSLKNVILSNNSLTGVIPNSLATLHQLQLLDVSYNQLTGSIPSFAPTVRVVKSGNNFGSGSSGGGDSDRSASGVAPGSNQSSSSPDHNGKSKSSTEFIVGMVVLVLFIAGCLFGLVYYLLGCKKKQNFKRVRMEASPERPGHAKIGIMGFNSDGKVKSELNTQSSDGNCSDITVRSENSENLMSIEDLWKATNNFSEDAILGSGGFGVVYKGVLSNGVIVAVKRCVLDLLSMKGMSEFKAEISLIGKAKHRHLVSLIGYCEHEKERLLVYEYMPEGTLAQHLFDREGSRFCPLTWKQRLTIALDVAKAMEYLHSFMQGSFIHRDLKPSNILLDKDLRGKVSDFGLLKLAGDNEKSLATRLAGTFGYLAPEYAITGKITRKIDVYAFGVILLELMTSRKVLDDTVPDEDANLVATFRRIHPRDVSSLDKFVDSSIFPNDESCRSIADVAEIAYHCTTRDPNYRPEMSNVVTMLSPIADQWSPNNYGDHGGDGKLSISLTSMVHKWQVSDDSSYVDSFSSYQASTSTFH